MLIFFWYGYTGSIYLKKNFPFDLFHSLYVAAIDQKTSMRFFYLRVNIKLFF